MRRDLAADRDFLVFFTTTDPAKKKDRGQESSLILLKSSEIAFPPKSDAQTSVICSLFTGLNLCVLGGNQGFCFFFFKI